MADGTQTLGHMLLNDALPGRMTMDGPVTKGRLKKEMTALAKSDPDTYVKTVMKLKSMGDEVATLEGISVGLDDIAPDYRQRDPIMKDALRRVKAAKTDAEKRKILLETQDKIVKATESHPSDMTIMAKSGGRGSVAQLMKIVSSPVVAMEKGEPAPWLVTKSYSQGLNPADAWVTGVESRRNAIASSNAVVEPGMVAKVVMNNMDDLVVTEVDCGTRGGMLLPLTDQVQDRYLARDEGPVQRNTLVTADVVSRLKKAKKQKILVRSVTACESHDGVCQKCVGLNEWGKPHRIGTNVGARSAQAMTEPLTQFALNAKHGVRLAKGQESGATQLTGLSGFRTLTEVPKSFQDKAAITEHDGRVESVKKAPAGGWHIRVSGKQYYTPPRLKPIVKEGDIVEAGDALSDGVALPNAVVKHKGIGAGRVYLSNQLTDLYRRQGVDIDRRHTELLARNAMKHVRIEDDPTDKFLRGDIVPYTEVQKRMAKSGKSVPVSKAKGHFLAEQTLHFSAGTRITPSVQKELKSNGTASVKVSDLPTVTSPVMKSMIQAPLLNDDWMSRLSHRYLKRTLVEGAGFGMTTDLQSTSPVPAYAVGQPFGTGLQGKYASDQGDVEKVASKAGLLKKILFGASDEFAESVARKGDDALQLVSDAPWTAGGVDTAALDAMRRMKRLPDEFMSQAGLIRDNTLTDEGARFIRTLDSNEKAFKKIGPALEEARQAARNPHMNVAQFTQEAVQSMPRRMSGESAKDFGQRMKTWEKANPQAVVDYVKAQQDIKKISPEAASMFTPEVAQQYAAARPGLGKRILRGAGDVLIGQNPLQIMKQRAQKGGLVGRGGLLHGEMAIDPDVMRAWRAARDPNVDAGYGGMILPGAMDVLNKGMAYGMPAAMVHEALTTEPPEGQSSLENVGGTLGDALGWSIGSPFGMVAGGAFAAPFTAAGKAIGRKMDPNYQPTPAQKAPSQKAPTAPGQGRAAQRQRQRQVQPPSQQRQPWNQVAQYGDRGVDAVWGSMQGHPYLARLNLAGDAFGTAQSEWQQHSPQIRKMLQQQLEDEQTAKQQMQNQRPPLPQQMKEDFSVRSGHYPARELYRMKKQSSQNESSVAPPFWKR